MIRGLVSIIIAAYNHSQFIQECLDSIRDQTYENWELIVADDASTDNSVKVYENWLKENNIIAKKVFHSENLGFANTLNECVKLCDGEFIKILAADDYIHPDYLTHCVQKLYDLGNKFGMVFTNTYFINEKSIIVDDLTDYNNTGNISASFFSENLRKNNCIAALTVLMTSEALLGTGPYNPDFLVEDYDRWLRINEKYNIAYIAVKLAYYRMHFNNVSNVKKNRIFYEDLMLRIKYGKDGLNKDAINESVERYYLHENHIFPNILKELYHQYKYKDRVLAFCIFLGLPSKIYMVLKKIRIKIMKCTDYLLSF